MLEMLTDRDIAYALASVGIPEGPRRQRTLQLARQDPQLLAALLDDSRLGRAVAGDPELLLKVGPYFFFSVLMRAARSELHTRTFTAEWLGPRQRVPVFDAPRVAAALQDPDVVHYLSELLASFTAVNRQRLPGVRGRRRERCSELNLEQLRRLRDAAGSGDRFALDRRLGDVALYLAGVFPDSAHGSGELDEWESESENRYRWAAQDPRARQCGLQDTLTRLAEQLRPVRKALNFVADRYLYPLHCTWFMVGTN